MANTTHTIKFTGQFDTSQITKGLQDIKKQVTNANISEDLKKQFETAFNKLQVNIPALEKLTSKEDFNLKDIQALQKLLKDVTKDWENLNKVTDQIDLSKTFSAKDLEKINNLDKQIKQTQDNIQKARKELVDAFSNETQISISNKNVSEALTELFTVKPDEIDNKFKEIQNQFSEGVQQTQVELENKLRGANIQKTSSQILDYFFGKDSGVEFADKVGPVKDQLNDIIRVYREAQQKGDIAGVAKQIEELDKVLTNTANFKFPEGYKLFGLPTQEDLDTLNEISKVLGKVKELAEGKEVFFTEEEANLLELIKQKTEAQAEAAKNAKEKQENFGKAVENTGKSIDNTKNKTEDLSKEYNRLDSQTKALQATFGGLASRIEHSVSALAVFNKASQIVRNAIRSVEDLDAAFTQIAIVSEQSGEQAWKLFDNFNKLAKQYSITTKDLTEGAKLFYQQGLNAADTMKMVEASTVSAALGEVTMTEAANTLTAAIQGYNESAAVAMDYTDKIAMVGAVSAADFNELSAAMEKTASSAYTAGIDFDHLLGYLGKMIEVTREAPANLGTAMKTIIARFEDMKKDPMAILEDGVSANKVEAALATIGIALRDSEGEFRALQDVMDELGMKWESLTRNQQAYIATVAAGSRQQSRFLAMMNDYDRTLDLIAESQNSAGAAAQQYAIYQDSIAAAQARLAASWEKFYSKVVDNDLIKFAINSLSNLIDALSHIPPVITAISAAFGALQIQNIIKNFTNSKSIIGSLVTDFRLLYMGAKDTSVSFEELVELSPKLTNAFKNIEISGKNIGKNFVDAGRAVLAFIKSNKEILIIGALVATTIGVITWALQKQKKEYEDNIKIIQEYNEESDKFSSRSLAGESLIKTYDELSSKISLTEEEQNELNSTIDQIKDIYPEAIEYVDEYGNKQLANADALRDNIELEKQLAKERQRAALKQRQELLSKDSKNWKEEDFNSIGFSNLNTSRYFNAQKQLDFYNNITFGRNTIDKNWKAQQILEDAKRSIDIYNSQNVKNDNLRIKAINKINQLIKEQKLDYIELNKETADNIEISKAIKYIEDLYANIPNEIERWTKAQREAKAQLEKENMLDLAFLDIDYNNISKEVETGQKIISAQIQAMFEKMDSNIWNEFLKTNNININNPEELTAKIQEILNTVTEDNSIELKNLFKDLNEGKISAEEFFIDFNAIAENTGNEAAKKFVESFRQYLEQQKNKEKEKFKEYLNSLGITQDSIELALENYQLGSGNKRQQDINDYFTESNGPMQSMIDQYLRIDQEVLDSLDESVAKAVEEGNITALQELPEQWLAKVEETDQEAASILLNGKISEAIEQLAATTSDKALEIADNIFTKKDYSSAIKATDLYNYREKLGDEWDRSYKVSSEGEIFLTDEAQRKIARNERKENIEDLEDQIKAIEKARDITQKMIEDNGDNNGELQKQVDSLNQEIDCFTELLNLARQLPDILFESMDITEDLITATEQLGEGYNKSSDSKALKYSAQVADEYKKVVDITKELDKQMKEVKSVSEETMTQMLELGDVFSDFFTVHDDGSIEYGLQNVESQYQSASDAILDIQRKRQEAELELKRQELDNEIRLNQAKMDGYNQIADALEEYANFKRKTDKNTTISEFDEAKARVENQISAAETSIQNAESTWDAQVAAAKMAYDQMAKLDFTFWKNLSKKDIASKINEIYSSFESVKAPEFGLIDLNDLIAHGSPEQLDEAAGKYRKAAEGLGKYIETLENAKKNLKVIDPTVYDTAIEKIKEMGKSGSEGFDKIAKAVEDLMDALGDLDKLLIDVKKDLKDISVDYNPFLEIFEEWEHEWDYYYNIKNLIDQIGKKRTLLDNIVSGNYASAAEKSRAREAQIGNTLAGMAANDTYITSLRAGLSQRANNIMENYGKYYKIDPDSLMIYQTDKNLNSIKELINLRKQEEYELKKINNIQENDLNLTEAKKEALEIEKGAYEDIDSTLESVNETLTDYYKEQTDQDGTFHAEARVTNLLKGSAADQVDEAIDTINEEIKSRQDRIQEIEVQLDLKGWEIDKLEEYVDKAEDAESSYLEMLNLFYDEIAGQQDFVQQLAEQRQYYIDTAIDMQQQLYDAIVENYQDEINEKKKQYDYLKQLDQDYLRSIKDNISKERQIREDANKQKSYQQNIQRAQLLQMDTSGSFRSELAALNKEIETQRQDLYDDLVDKQVQALEKEIDKRHELYDKEVAALEERLNYMQENAILLWEMVNDIVSRGSEAMMATLENTSEYINSNDLQRMEMRNAWEQEALDTYKAVEGGFITTMNTMVAMADDFANTKYPEIQEAIDEYAEVFDETKGIIEAYNAAMSEYSKAIGEGKTELDAYNAAMQRAGEILGTSAEEAAEKLGLGINDIKEAFQEGIGDIFSKNSDLFDKGSTVFQGILDDFMETWNDKTYKLTGYSENWKDTVDYLQQETAEHIDELRGYYDEEGWAREEMIGSIEEYDEQLRSTTNEMYQDFIDERDRYRSELEGIIADIQSRISDAIGNAAQAIQDAANNIQFNSPQSTYEPSGSGEPTYTPTPTQPDTGSPAKEPAKKQPKGYAYDFQIQNTKSGQIFSYTESYNTSQEAKEALNDLVFKFQDRINKGLFKILMKKTYPYYLKGGLADFTGPAWLDGTKSNPERILSPRQTKLFESMVSSLEKASNNSNINSALGSSYNIGDINTNINVEKLDNETDIDRVAKQVENRIMKSIRNRVSIAVA